MDKSYVSIETKICPVCGKEHETNSLLLDRRLRDTFEPKTATGYELCADDKSKKEAGYLALIACDETKSSPDGSTIKFNDAFRTGEIIHIKREVAKKLFNFQNQEQDFVFIDRDLALKLKEMMKNAV